MKNLLIKPRAGTSLPIDMTPETAGWTYIGFRLHRLMPRDELAGFDDGRETCLVAVSGKAQLSIEGADYGPLGERMSPFEGLPHAVYMPPAKRWTVLAETEMELAVCTAPGRLDSHPIRGFKPQHLSTEKRGQGTNTRYVTNILAEGDDAAESLFVIELRTPGGHTSSYPPHKHDTDSLPGETALEETYYSRFNPPQGFAFQRIYTDDRSLNEALILEDGTLSLVPRGYHPCAVCHGYELYQLCVMAGPRRQWRFHNDESHSWLIGK